MAVQTVIGNGLINLNFFLSIKVNMEIINDNTITLYIYKL